jgi:hypothetical protein
LNTKTPKLFLLSVATSPHRSGLEATRRWRLGRAVRENDQKISFPPVFMEAADVALDDCYAFLIIFIPTPHFYCRSHLPERISMLS